MRKLWLLREDYELFQQEINPYEFEFFRNHLGTFKRMWADQVGHILEENENIRAILFSVLYTGKAILDEICRDF